MIGWLYRIVVGNFSDHEHKWIIINKVTIQSSDGNEYIEYHLQCEICGNVKSKDLA